MEQRTFLRDYPGMSFAPMKGSLLSLRGTFRFKASYKDGPSIKDSYELEIHIPEKFPYELPKVKELGMKIPRDSMHHVNWDGTLCFGAPLRVVLKLYKSPTINTYAEECLVPYLYAVSHKLQYGGEFIFGELKHGEEGVLNDYLDLLGLTHPKQVVETLTLLGMKKNIANKRPCPCGCGKRLGSCRFNDKVNELRRVAPRSFYSNHVRSLGSGM